MARPPDADPAWTRGQDRRTTAVRRAWRQAESVRPGHLHGTLRQAVRQQPACRQDWPVSAYSEANDRVHAIAMESYFPAPTDEAGATRHAAAAKIAERYMEIARMSDFERVMCGSDLKQLADAFDAEFNPEPPQS